MRLPLVDVVDFYEDLAEEAEKDRKQMEKQKPKKGGG